MDVEGEIIDVEEAPLPVASAPQQSTALVARDDISVDELVGQSSVIEQAMRRAMRDGVHYGRIPGVDKPTLLKPGAEKLLVLFRLAPSYESEKIWHPDGHLTVSVRCTLHHIPTGLKIAEGEGLCTTRESRYAWRKGGRVCPECGEQAIIKGKKEYGGGWLCFAKRGGCGAKWPDGSAEAETFENAVLDRVENPDIADSYNTVLKMADKRALLAAILNGTAASDTFTQDMEDSVPRREDSPVERSEPVSRDFDPSKDRRKDGPTKSSGWKGIARLLNEIDPSMDWSPIIRSAISGLYGGDGDFRKLPEDQRNEAQNRAANAAGRITELNAGPFLTDDIIIKAFSEMFDGVVVAIPAPDKGEVNV